MITPRLSLSRLKDALRIHMYATQKNSVLPMHLKPNRQMNISKHNIYVHVLCRAYVLCDIILSCVTVT